MASPIIALANLSFGSGLDAYLTKQLFKIQKKSKKQQDVFKVIKHREPLKIKTCGWLRNKKSARLQEQALGYVKYELDIVQFLRK